MDVLMVRSLMIKLYRKGLHSYSIFTVAISRPQHADHFDQRSI